MDDDRRIRCSPLSLPRRRFVQGLGSAAAGGSAALARAARAETLAASPPTLDGTRFDLVIGETAVNFTGRRRIATTVNGQLPGPILRMREGDTVTINVVNRLKEPTSIHWHGVRLPSDQDGVPGLSYRGIAPGESFTYRFPVVQSGTYWYHSHSGMQEQTGLYGPLIFEPKSGREPCAYDRDYVVHLSDWSDEDPMTIVSNLKQDGEYYNYHQRTVGTLASDIGRQGLKATLAEQGMWARMRMTPTDIMDVTGATYTFLVNGRPPAANWTALFKPGERVRLRVINAASMSTFDVRIPGLKLTVVAADGYDVEPVVVDEFRIGVAETYDVIVEPRGADAFTLFAQAQDRSGYARATLATRPGLSPPVPALDPVPVRTMADMGMTGMSGMSGMVMTPALQAAAPAMTTTTGRRASIPGMSMAPEQMAAMPGMAPAAAVRNAPSLPAVNADGVAPASMAGGPEVDNVAAAPKDRQGEGGDGLDGNGRRHLTYADLRALAPDAHIDQPIDREVVFHLTGNMQRWVWGFDGRKFSEAEPVRLARGERVRFVLVNDTMMEHPIHLHGFIFRLENGQGANAPLKHTVNVKPGERVGFVYTADTPGLWAFHCHLLYHMETGMFRTVVVA